MKSYRFAVLAAAGLAASQLATRAALAADQHFDSDGIGPVQAGPGVWDTTTPRWSDDTAGTTFGPFLIGSNAIFNGPGGGVMIDGALAPGGIKLSAGNWSFFRNPVNTGASLDTSGAPFVWDIAPGGKAGILNTIGGSGEVKIIGGGTVDIYAGFAGGANFVTVEHGTLRFASGAGDVGANTSVILGSQGVLDMSIINDAFGSLAGSAGSVVKLGTLNLGIATGSLIQVGGNGGFTEFAGSIQGDGGRLNKQGGGFMTLSGANTYTGYTRVQGGTLTATGGSALSDVAPVLIDNIANVILRIDGNEAIGVVQGGGAAGGIFDAGPGNVTIGGDNFSGNFDGEVQGSGTIRKVGTGTQIFNAPSGTGTASTFTGKYIVEQGTLAFRTDARLGPNPATAVDDAITLAGGNLSTTGFGGTALGNNKGITVTKDSSITSLGSVTSTLTVGAGAGGARISGTNSITKRGPGVLAINTDSSASYSGTWKVVDGTLSTGRGIAAPFGTGSFDIEGGTLQLRPGAGAGNVNYQLATATPTSGLAYGPGAVLVVDRNTNTSLTANFGSPTATGPALVRKDRGTLVISAAGGVANLGNPTAGEKIVFNGYTEPTNFVSLLPGVIGNTSFGGTANTNAQITVGDFLGYDGANGVVAATYSSSDLATSTPASITQQAADVTLAAPAATGALKVVIDGANNITVGNGTAPGMVILNASDITSTGGALNFGASQGVIYTSLGDSSISAPIQGTGGLAKLGTGTLTLNAQATYTGNTDLSQGTLKLTANNQLPTTSHFRINGNGTLDLSANGGVSQEFASFGSENFTPSAGPGGAVVIMGDASVLKFGGGDTAYRGDIVSTSPAGEGNATIWKAGPGKLVLGTSESTSSHAGGTAPPAINYDQLWVSGGGVVEISSANSLPDHPIAARGINHEAIKLDNGTLRLNTLNTGAITTGSLFTITNVTNPRRGLTVGPGGGTIDVANPQEIVFLQQDNNEHTNLQNVITGSGNLTKTGPGFLRLSYGNSFTGRWIVKEGNLQYQAGQSLGATPATFIHNQLEIDGGMIQNNGSGVHEATRGIFVTANGGTINNGPFVFNGVVSGPGTLMRIGGGSQTGGVAFNADNNTFGGLLVRQGIVYFNGNNSAGSGTVTMDPDAYVALGKNDGPTNSINNTIVLGGGSVIDIRVASGNSPVVGSIYEGQTIGLLDLRGKITGPGTLFKGYASQESYFQPPSFTRSERELNGTVVLSNSTNDFTGDFNIMYGVVLAGANNALGATTGPTSVFDGGVLAFQNVNYAAAEPLYISGAGYAGEAALQARAGDSTFAGPVQITKDVSIGADPSGSLNLTGRVSGNATVTKTGGGRITLSGANNALPGTTVVQEGLLEFAANHSIGKLDMRPVTAVAVGGGDKVLKVRELAMTSFSAPDAKLDLRAGRLAWDYDTANGSPLQNVRSAIVAAKNADWAGNGITSSLIGTAGNANKAIGYGEASAVTIPGGNWGGVTVDDSTVLARYTILGDASLDGAVTFPDLVALAQNYNNNSGTAVWTQGDFDYDGNVGFTDLVALAQNYNQSLPPAAALEAIGAGAAFQEDLARAFAQVPEPGSMSLLALGGAALAGRRRRRRA